MTDARISVIGSEISICDWNGALNAVEKSLQTGRGGYICFTNAHGAVMGRRDPKFRAATNGSLLSVADGRWVFWTGRLKGATALGHIPGPDFMPRALARFAHRRHFFLGSTPETLSALTTTLRERIPGLNICGTLSPPFGPLTPEGIQAQCAQVLRSGAEIVWVGLGAPKQELWMAEASKLLSPAILFGVGAAFDFHAGTARRAHPTLSYLGLEWVHRLLQEPRRLWKRYLVGNALFIYYAIVDALIGEKPYLLSATHRDRR
jgi:N-acetylglucosaminyldiphosphoundecaprenol N-acetyl-beta-D-mannosaminyltransferase